MAIRALNLNLIIFLFMASLVSASEITITNRSDFENLVIDKKLERFLISLSVFKDGKIKGSAAGREVTGDWDWIDGFFCRNLLWGARELKYNCQLVTFDGKRLRFTSDRGKGQSASFALR
jgi:hypothetical protein